MSRPQSVLSRAGRHLCALAVATLTACGGGDGNAPPLAADCSVRGVNDWLQGYMNDWYFWYRLSPNPSPAGYGSLESYFQARLYTGTDPDFPADRWSYYTPTAEYDRFFGDGQTLGYGVMVAGLEVTGHPELPLYVRYVEPGSPAATAGVRRGDQVLSINGTAAADYIAADDFSVLTPSAAGQTLALVLRNATGDRSVSVTSSVYTLTPVNGTRIVTTPGGRKLGYVMVKDMINQALTPIDTAFSQFRSAGVDDVVIDLRYNGGGLVSTARSIASYPAKSRTAGAVYTSLLYNDRQQGANQDFHFESPFNGLGLSKVYVLTGPRTCSASEQLINALTPFATVVTVGDVTCGKPVGFLPQADGCGTTFSTVNFESVNARNEGRYFDGFEATCAVSEDFSAALGGTADPLLAAAQRHADGGGCPAAVSTVRTQGLRGSALRQALGARGWQGEPGDRFGGMNAN